MSCIQDCTKCLEGTNIVPGAEWRTGGVFIKQLVLPSKFTLAQQHIHLYAHVTLVASGGVKMWSQGQYRGEFTAPSVIPIPAGVAHGFEAIADDTVLYCIHNVGEGAIASVGA